ncbi:MULTISPECIES: ribbon-helix-helix domain-containing protein [unclassified Microcoleus]|uniref:ribbon-helix-helix domain-containing protein n=1 Tax=unclassified Microcoleus TaxID=2642155 RepID=UPI002FD2E2DE
MIALTPTGVEKLDELAAAFSMSRSEFIERMARRMFSVQGIESTQIYDGESKTPCPLKLENTRKSS